MPATKLGRQASDAKNSKITLCNRLCRQRKNNRVAQNRQNNSGCEPVTTENGDRIVENVEVEASPNNTSSINPNSKAAKLWER